MPSSRQKRMAKTSRKRGANRNEVATKHHKEVHNFKQSKDIHEDRGTLQTRLGKFKERGFRVSF